MSHKIMLLLKTIVARQTQSNFDEIHPESTFSDLGAHEGTLTSLRMNIDRKLRIKLGPIDMNSTFFDLYLEVMRLLP